MSDDDAIKKLSLELHAVRHWLRVLWVVTYPAHRLEPDDIEELIVQAKNAGPEDMPWVPAGQFDRASAERLPAIERVGRDIAFVLAVSRSSN